MVEPLVMKKHYELLEKIIESGHAKHIYLKYQTNLTKTKKADTIYLHTFLILKMYL